MTSGLYDSSTGLSKCYHGASCENNHQYLLELDSKEIEEKQLVGHSQIQYLVLGAAIDGGSENTEKLKPMKHKEAICGQNGKSQKDEPQMSITGL